MEFIEKITSEAWRLWAFVSMMVLGTGGLIFLITSWIKDTKKAREDK